MKVCDIEFSFTVICSFYFALWKESCQISLCCLFFDSWYNRKKITLSVESCVTKLYRVGRPSRWVFVVVICVLWTPVRRCWKGRIVVSKRHDFQPTFGSSFLPPIDVIRNCSLVNRFLWHCSKVSPPTLDRYRSRLVLLLQNWSKDTEEINCAQVVVDHWPHFSKWWWASWRPSRWPSWSSHWNE